MGSGSSGIGSSVSTGGGGGGGRREGTTGKGSEITFFMYLVFRQFGLSSSGLAKTIV